ncbi:tRNA-dependent cyclodipeptide synthase [Actinomadura macrotermitis]|uniref:Cyclodipeptide synthase n=1 Tax=Actinomadura macrotermitis TaxID=2585200 RepID=A0A7K0BQM3_9ACTN|nr:tRNA-dependent cyclodipeptide synthase [Actinomadura macrotermitis]MQY03222.1 Cyclo(L-leucyl-L-leucyl) synthase [Actinomadura macrotermitis]
MHHAASVPSTSEPDEIGAESPPGSGSEVEVEPCGERSAQLLARGRHLVIQVSPGNPYFSTVRLAVMFGWAARRFQGVDVVMSDLEMTAATYLGQGRPEHRARKKAKADVRQMKHRIERALRRAGDPGVRVSEFGDWADAPAYRRACAYLDEAIADPGYGPIYRDDTRIALKAGMPEGWEPTDAQLATGLVHSYKALPFALNAPEILGVPEAVTTSSRPAEHVTYFFTGGAKYTAFPGQGYTALRTCE